MLKYSCLRSSIQESRQLRVLGGDPPIDWSTVHSRAEYGLFADGERRDDSLAAIVRDKVLRDHGKTLVIYGNAHFERLQQNNPGKVFVVNLLVNVATKRYVRLGSNVSRI